MGKIIAHLIRVMGVLVVVETPERAPSDSDTAFARRVQRRARAGRQPQLRH